MLRDDKMPAQRVSSKYANGALAAAIVEIELDVDDRLLQASPGADALFDGLAEPGKPLRDLFDEAEKFGLLSQNTARNVLAALDAGHCQHLFEMRDGRFMLLSRGATNSETVIITLTDVSHAIQVTLSQQRDALTGLPNRVKLLRNLEEHLASAPTPAKTALLYLDLDRFKFVNDTLGHPIGDALLKLVSDRIAKILEPEDTLARLGGDEFVILQHSGSQPQAAETLASRIIDLVARTYLIQGHSVQIGVSIGIALAGLDGDTPEQLIRNADLALFKAKSSGRSTFRFFTEAMDQEMQARRAMEIDLRRALALEQFFLVYQPQFQIDGNRLVGFEALIRWATPERGVVSPADFIPLAEEIGMIDRLGEWVLRTACRDAAGWPEPITVSVNLSPLQFKNPRLVDTIVSALEASGLPGNRLDVEITEGVLMEEQESALQVLKSLKARGVKVSMDDFGTGYSSLSYLQKFPFDKIKIDQSFIRSLETSADSAAIVRAVTALGESLGMVTIAEGVETKSQLNQITQDGCKQVQGFLTGRPLPAADAMNLISHAL